MWPSGGLCCTRQKDVSTEIWHLLYPLNFYVLSPPRGGGGGYFNTLSVSKLSLLKIMFALNYFSCYKIFNRGHNKIWIICSKCTTMQDQDITVDIECLIFKMSGVATVYAFWNWRGEEKFWEKSLKSDEYFLPLSPAWDYNKKVRQLREQLVAEGKYNPQKMFECMLNTAQLEFKLKEVG